MPPKKARATDAAKKARVTKAGKKTGDATKVATAKKRQVKSNHAESAAGEDSDLDVKALLRNIGTTVGTLNKKLAALDTKFDTLGAKVNAFTTDVSKKLQKLSTRIDPSTHAAVANAASSVIKADFGTHEGGESTWTLVKWGKRVFAIGAAHCALYLAANEQSGEDCTPVFLPFKFAALATKVYVSKDVDGEAPFRDIVMVELKSSPKGMRGVPVNLATAFDTEQHKLVSTFAATSAFDLLGSAPHPVTLADAKSKHCFIFQVTEHEAGNSGALLWAMGEENTAVPYGVFFGIDDAAFDEKKVTLHRGVGVPLPRAEGDGFVLSDGEQMTCYPVTSFAATSFQYDSANGVFDAVSVEESAGAVWSIKEHHCVFINETFGMNGAVLCNSLGCGWAK